MWLGVLGTYLGAMRLRLPCDTSEFLGLLCFLFVFVRATWTKLEILLLAPRCEVPCPVSPWSFEAVSQVLQLHAVMPSGAWNF